MAPAASESTKDASPAHPLYGRASRGPKTAAQREIDQTLEAKRHGLVGESRGIVYKVYRLWPLPAELQGEPMWVCTFEHRADLDDLEEHIRGLGVASAWVSGKYEVRAVVQGENGLPRWSHALAFDFPAAPQLTAASPLASGLTLVKETVGVAKELGLTGGGEKLEGLAQAFVSIFAQGINAAKASGAGGPDLSVIIKPFAEAFAEVVKRPVSATTGVADITQWVGTLRQLGVIPERGREAEPESPLDRVREITTLVDALRPFTDRGRVGGRAEAPSVWAELFRSPEAVRGLSQLIQLGREAVGAWRLSTLMRSGAQVTAPVPLPASTSTETPAAAPVAPPSPFAPFRAAIAAGTDAVFPEMDAALRLAGAGPILDAIASGQTTWAAWVAALPAEVRAATPELAEPGAPAFFDRFTEWLRARAASSPPATQPLTGDNGRGGGPPERTLARCEKCGTEYDDPEAVGDWCDEPLDDAPDAEGRIRVCGGTIVAVPVVERPAA